MSAIRITANEAQRALIVKSFKDLHLSIDGYDVAKEWANLFYRINDGIASAAPEGFEIDERDCNIVYTQLLSLLKSGHCRGSDVLDIVFVMEQLQGCVARSDVGDGEG